MFKLAIYTVLFLAFFGNSLIGYNLAPNSLRVLTECAVYFLLLLSLIYTGKKKKTFQLHLIVFYFIYVITALASTFANSVDAILAIKSIRLVLRFYVLYLALINMEFEDALLKKFNKLLIFLFVIQLPVQLIKFFFFGVSENSIGTYATHGGGQTTIIPLMALGYISAYYFLHKKSYTLLILAVGFIGYGIIGAKFALFFLYPLSFISLYYINVIRIEGFRIPVDIYRSLIVLILIFAVGTLAIKYQRRANKEYSVGGSVDLSYAVKSALEYTSKTDPLQPELATGRFSTTKMTFKYLFAEGIIKICLGYGPGVLTKLSHMELDEYNTKEKIIAGSYGHTGAIYVTMDSGIIGLIVIACIYVAFINNCIKLYKNENDKYWKAFASGSLFFSLVNIFIFLAYNDSLVNGDTMPPVFFYCMATVYVRLKRIEKANSLA